MENDNIDGLVDNLIMLSFVPPFPLTKSFLFDRRNIKVVIEEVLYFLLGKLGFTEQFNSNCWPVASRSSMHEFKVAVIKMLEELKRTNALFKSSPLQVRKSLLDEAQEIELNLSFSTYPVFLLKRHSQGNWMI